MLTAAEWLARAGFTGGNPFALKQADDEGERLQEYFIEHPAYNAILDSEPRSSILHAPRGAGKSSTRRMFERYCREHASTLKPLVVYLFDWMPVVERLGTLPDADMSLRYHLDELLRQVVLALAHPAALHPAIELRQPAGDMAGYLHGLCHTYGSYLTPGQRELLRKRGWLLTQGQLAAPDYDLSGLPVTHILRLLVEVLQAIGYHTCYVLVDRIDELAETTHSWEASARLLAPLVSNLAVAEVRGLAFKYFVPSEVVAVLRQHNRLRTDRIGCFSLTWNEQLLLELLQARLQAFSDGTVSSLASIAGQDIRDIDDRLCRAAGGSPRQLLLLGEGLLQFCMQEADDNHLLIEPHHLEAALVRLTESSPVEPIQPGSPPSQMVQHSNLSPATEAEADDGVLSDFPLLSIHKDGSIWRGDEEIEGWQMLGPLQRVFLQYLYDHRGQLCLKRDIIDHVWQDKVAPAGDDALRKLGERVIQFIEPNPLNPVYIQKVRGGHYRLDHAEDV